MACQVRERGSMLCVRRMYCIVNIFVFKRKKEEEEAAVFLMKIFFPDTFDSIHTFMLEGSGEVTSIYESVCVFVYLVPQAQSGQRRERGEGREADWLSHPL